jgi:hypothetical protein
MALFDPLRDLFRKRRAARLDEQAADLQLVISRRESLRGNFVFPGPDISAVIEHGGQRVGQIEYGISPLQDRVYISEFEIFSSHNRRGLGQAALWRLWTQYHMPLSPMHEVGTSTGFWAKVRTRFAAAGVELTQDIRTADQDGEMERWQHLVPELDHERQIRELMASPEWPAIKARMEKEYGL